MGDVYEGELVHYLLSEDGAAVAERRAWLKVHGVSDVEFVFCVVAPGESPSAHMLSLDQKADWLRESRGRRYQLMLA